MTGTIIRASLDCSADLTTNTTILQSLRHREQYGDYGLAGAGTA